MFFCGNANVMSMLKKRKKPMTNLRIYVTQFLIFSIGGILFVVGLYQFTAELYTSGFILSTLGMLFVAMSYLYARMGAKVISTNCPNCDGLGYFEVGSGKNIHKETCEVCGGSGKLYDKSYLYYLQAKQLSEKKEKNNVPSSESKFVEKEHYDNTEAE